MPPVHPLTPIITPGFTTVLIGGMPATPSATRTGCGAIILPPEAPTVLIGG
jgi:uncharacterized Zn-binding protein involved in type VI secretion